MIYYCQYIWLQISGNTTFSSVLTYGFHVVIYQQHVRYNHLWNLIDTYQKLGKPTEISITVNGEHLERVDEYKYLGMMFDKNFNWHNHIDKMCANISQ